MKTLAMCFLILVAPPTGTARQQEPVRVVKQVDPHYPAIVKAAGIEGMVWLKLGISATGEIETIDVVKATDSVFVQPTLDAVQQFTFAPATNDGKPVKAQVMIPFKFTLGPGSYKSGYNDDISECEHDATQILRGGLTNELRSRVDDSAAVTTPRNKRTNLLHLLGNPQAAKQFVEGGSMTIESSRAIPVVDGAMCYLLKTKPTEHGTPLFHAIVFVNKSGDWKITDWQVWE